MISLPPSCNKSFWLSQGYKPNGKKSRKQLWQRTKVQSEDRCGSHARRGSPAPGRPVFPGLVSGHPAAEVWLDLAVKENDWVKATDGNAGLESRSSRFHGVPR